MLKYETFANLRIFRRYTTNTIVKKTKTQKGRTIGTPCNSDFI